MGSRATPTGRGSGASINVVNATAADPAGMLQANATPAATPTTPAPMPPANTSQPRARTMRRRAGMRQSRALASGRGKLVSAGWSWVVTQRISAAQRRRLSSSTAQRARLSRFLTEVLVERRDFTVDRCGCDSIHVADAATGRCCGGATATGRVATTGRGPGASSSAVSATTAAPAGSIQAKVTPFTTPMAPAPRPAANTSQPRASTMRRRSGVRQSGALVTGTG